MNRCGYEQNAAMAAAADREMGMAMMMMETVVCPKPRRLGALNPSVLRPATSFRFAPPSPPRRCYVTEPGDSNAGAELLDLILSKRGYQVASPPPFYCGLPPRRASNPVIQDAEFESENRVSFSPLSPSASGCVMRLGQKPAAVRSKASISSAETAASPPSPELKTNSRTMRHLSSFLVGGIFVGLA